MADESATGQPSASGERRAVAGEARGLHAEVMRSTVASMMEMSPSLREVRLRDVVLNDDQEEEDIDEEQQQRQPQRQPPRVIAASIQRSEAQVTSTTTTTTTASVVTATTVTRERTPLPSLVNRSSATLAAVETANNSPRPTSQSMGAIPSQSRNQRLSSAGDNAANSTVSGMEWGVDGDEGWMPKAARLHSGKTRSCAVCFAPLQYSSMQSWDEYVQSDEYLRRLQENLLCDTFISSLICGESTSGGDLPTEHRMHKNRKLKCRQSVHDYVNMTSAGVIDQAYKENSSVRILEEMLLHGLSTPLFASVLERRLAVISHSTDLARKLMHESPMQRLPREIATPTPNVELHHLAIQTLSALLKSFDFSANSHTGSSPGSPLQVFEEVTRLLACFPALSLYSFWSPAQRFPEASLVLDRSMVDASSSATTPRLLAAEFAIDGSDTSYWQSQPRPGVTYFNVRHTELSSVSSISLRWHLKCFPKSVKVQYRVCGSDEFTQLTEQTATTASGPEYFETRFPRQCEEVRLVMSGMPTANRNSCYAIEAVKLNVRIKNSLFVDPKVSLQDISAWLLKAIEHKNDDVAVEAIVALRGWTLATASLSGVLSFMKMLQKVKDQCPSGEVKQRSIGGFALDQARILVKGLKAYQLDEMERATKNVAKKSTSESRKIRGLFEPSCCSAGVTVEDGGMAVRTRETSYQYAAVNVGISSGRASWKFRLDNDTVDDEMTCFGAAILPVTVSGYDSSPNLWMLRGYNGNLYARGHKLSRSIGKVHPGDTIQIDVDMGEGTLAYKINDTDYGAVFTDLAGHEVYPAVSFYGSGKVITLLGVEKWDDAESGASAVDPIFLSNLKEYHYSVGYGTFGKGTQLGYTSDTDSRSAGATPTPTNSVIRVGGEPKQRALSTHPPARGDAFVLYDLGQAYSKFSGSVAINDDVSNDILQQHGVTITFSIVGDGVSLWQSKPLAHARSTANFDIDIDQVRMLELRASCPGSNQCAHAVWVDPHLVLLDEWTCEECAIINKGYLTSCLVCDRQTSREKVSAEKDQPLSILANPVGTQSTTKTAKEETPFDAMMNTILAEVVDLTQIGQGTVGKCVRFEQPFCRQPCEDVFEQLLSMIDTTVHENLDTSYRQTQQQRTLGALGLLQANLGSLTSYEVDPSDLGITKSTIQKLKLALEELAHVCGPSKQSPLMHPREIEVAAANALIAGLATLYSPSQKVELLLMLLRGHRASPFPAHSAKRLILSSILRVLALPGRDGVLNFLPTMSVAPFGDSDTNDSDGFEQVPLGDIEEVVSLLIATACSSESSTAELAETGDGNVPVAAMRLLQSYQLMLLAEAIEVTSKTAPVNPLGAGQQLVRAAIQEATVNFSSLLLRYCGNVISQLVEQHAEQALSMDTPEAIVLKGHLNARASEQPILSKLLPWLVSCLCLLRRQSWLAIPILPSIVKFSSVLDQYCSELSAVKASESRVRRLEKFVKARAVESQELERMLATDTALATHHQAMKPMYNVFKQLYTGDKDHFEGQIGFQFEASSTFSIIALGRSVNPHKNGGQLVRQHTIRLWEEASQVLLAQVTVGATSRKDAMGYAFEPLSAPAKLTQGKLYRLTTQEFANGGDPWYKKENLPDEEYDQSYIKILRDCYASGSTSFPNSQNLSGAAYGVPTFLVEGENPLSKVPRFVAPFGATSIRFNAKRKCPGTTISHSGTSAHVLDGGVDQWQTFFAQTAAYSGVHAIDFVVKCGKPGGVASGHVCVGADWASASDFGKRNQSSFLGTASTGFGWMPSVGSLWVMGKRVPYGARKPVNSGDILTIVVDYDHELVSFAHNGVDMGIAIGSSAFAARFTLPSGSLPPQILPGISLNGSLDVAHVRPGGVAGSTLRLHWLLDLHTSISSLAGRVCGTLIAGNPVDGTEEELLPWLQSPLLSGGVSIQGAASSSGREELTEWSAALLEEDAKWKMSSHPTGSTGAPVRPIKQIERVMREDGIPKLTRKSSFFDDLGVQESNFLDDLVNDMGDGGASAVIISWFEKASPDRSFLSRLGKFPMCERPMCAALIKHSPIHVLHEVQAIISSSKAPDGYGSVDHIDLVPSDDLALIWKRIVMLRHWLIKTRQEYRARASQDNSPADSGDQVPEDGSNQAAELDMKITIAKSFDDLVLQIHERASFLCNLNPPSEERERMRMDSQLALSNLAEKWSAQKTPPSLEPMLERWKSLRESDSSKWSGIVDVLRAQHRWRKRRASINLTSTPVPDASVQPLEPLKEEEEDDDGNSSKNLKYRDSFAAMLRACDLYIRNGIGAPPEILRTLLDRRQRRSECRVFGLDAMKSLLTSLSMDSTRHNALMFLRPSFRGFTEDEKESRDLNDGQVIAETFRATVRHHYLKGLEGCSRRTVSRVQRSFWNLYSALASLVTPSGSGDAIDSSLKQAIVCAWCLDFESRDHQFILKSDFLSTLQNEFSMGAVLQRTYEEVDELKLLQQVVLADTSSDTGPREDPNWRPLSDEFVQRSALSSGLITKRDIMLLVLRAPRFACSRKWWQENILVSDDSLNTAASAAAPATRHTVSSMSLRYSELMRNLQSKLSWCEEHTLDRKVLQLGVNSLSSTGSAQGGASSQAKADQVSYAEVPALGEAANFTMEMWIYPTELGGYRALRADNGLQTASVYVELVDRHIQVAVNGNCPREQLFKTARFESHVWTHVAIVYQPAMKSVQLVVNGVNIETKIFTHVGKAVIFRESRIGCWLGESNDSSALSAGPQRVFKGSIAEIRLWRVARTSEEIRRDYQRAIPCPLQKTNSTAASDIFSHLIGLWHLDEGEGVCGNNRVEPTGAQASQRIMETAGCNASLMACHWTRANVPVWSGAKVDSLTGDSWCRVVKSLRSFQRRIRASILRQTEAAVQYAKAINAREERALTHEWMEEEDSEFGDGDDSIDSGIQAERWTATESAVLKILATSTDDTLIHQKYVKRCAWIVFRFLSHTAICGTQKRTDSEASTVAAAAKSRRKLRIQSDSAGSEASSPVASLARAATFEEDDVTKTAELASDAAKTAVTNRKLQEPMVQTLWFSNEVYRKIFEIIEKELGFATVMIQAAEGLTRAQRMVRSTSTPVQDRNVVIRPQQSVLVHGSSKRAPPSSTSAGFPDRRSTFSSSRGDSVVLEPLEVEMHVFNVLTFVLSQSTSEVATTHLARPRMLRELLQLLRLGSPRSQRIVKLILRRICASGVVGPSAVAEIWGSESVLVDLLLDQVAESVCSTAAPMSTLGLSASASVAAESSSSTSAPVAPITESLANPVGFRSGQVYLAAASESVALLRLLMTDRRWGPVVADLLSVAVKNVTPILSRGAFQSGASSVDPAGSDIRVKTAIIRAVGALCVLGSHTDCIRIGGKVEVTAKDTHGGEGKTMIDYGFNFSSDSKLSNHRPTLATLIELNARSSTARVVFDGSDESDPSHNVQEVSLATVSPVEEVHLPGDTAPSLSAEMMPVILKLASLDESGVISSFDDLWRMQIRSRALLAFESILRHSASIAHTLLTGEGQSATARIPPSLLEAALSPVSLSTFISVPFLQERGRMILCRLIEASTPFGEPMFRGLPDPKPFTPEGSAEDNGREGALVEASDDPVEEETEEYRVRRGFASTLAAMGFEFDLCMAALENSRNDPNLAVEWLMGPGAIDYQARQEARRLAEATIASRRAAAATGTSTSREGQRANDMSGEMSLEVKAEELQSISGMPYRLAFCALELSNEDPNRAMEWLMENGNRYTDKPESLVLLSDELRTETSLSLSDTAALEGIDQPDPLVSSASHETSIETTAGSSGSSPSTSPSPSQAEESASDTTNIMAVTLAPILATLPDKPPASKKWKSNPNDRGAAESLSSGFAALDPDYLMPYVLLTVSDEIGPVQRLSTTGRTGVFRAFSPKDGVLITFLNTETGAYEDEWHAPKDVRRITKIYDEALDGVSSIHRVALRTEKALSTHYARRGVAALLRAWDETRSDCEDRASMTLSDAVLTAVGGPRQFVNLLKLIAASEMVFSRKQQSSVDALEKNHSFSSSSSSRARSNYEDPVSILHDLKVIALKILREEAQAGKLSYSAASQWLQSGSPRVASPPGSPRLQAVKENKATARQPATPSFVESGDQISVDEEEDLNHAIALSMVEVASNLPAEETKEEENDDATFMQKLYSSNPRALRARQPSYTEAQEVASAYLGGSINDHDGLLASVLVKECVSHFVESTRVAGEGAKSTGSTESEDAAIEYQSLHPYYGRCEYTRAVSLDKSHRCVRIKFDQRCKLGPKAKLTFYSDASCEKVITVIDAACTTPAPGRGSSSSSPYLSDVMIPSHQFWFKFTASEDDLAKNNGYGFRFQVKPMQSISWANESEVQTNASLEWACWVLEFLLNEATDLVARGAVHNRKIYGALVRYLRSPGAPFKSRVVRLLIQLLHHPDQFPVSEIPDLEPLEGISRLAVGKAKQEKEAGKVFLSAQLLQLVELSIVTRRAADAFKQARSRVEEATAATDETPMSKITSASIVIPTPVERKEIPETLNDVVAIARFLLGDSDELPPHALMAIWLDVFGSTDIIETEHPYSSSSRLTGTVDFPGAQALLATFDSRCATTSGAQLHLQSRQDTAAAGRGSTDRSKWSFGGASDLWPSGAVDVANGSSLTYSFSAGENPDALFGVSVCIAAVGLQPDQQLARASVDKLCELLRVLQQQRLASNSSVWTTAMHCQLVDWVNNLVENSGGGPSGLATNASSGSSIASLDLKPADIRIHRTRDALRCTQLLDTSLTQLQLRFSLLKYFNQCIKHVLPLLDLRDTDSPWTLAHTLRRLGHCVFFDIKNALVEAAVDATNMPGDVNSSTNTARITLDRLQALESRDDREVEPSVSECFFAQAFRQLHQVDPSLFRRKIDNKGRLFSVKFRGEEGVDWGGVYREGVNSMVDDLFSAHFNLFVLCPNGQHDTGTNRAMYLPNPKCTSPIAIQMYEFVGKLLGISLRTHGDFPFAFPSLVWKQLIGQPLDQNDLEGSDAMFVQMLDGIQNCERDGIVTEDEFDAAFEGLDLRFTAFDCNGQEMELVEEGKTKRVTFANRSQYCKLAEAYRLQESAKQIAAMARGLATVFPLRVLTLLTWNEMEMLTCGSPKIDIALWKQHTRYDGYNENDDTVKIFWDAMASFSDEQRSDFVRFAWGRSRLPRGKWPQPFKLTKKGGRDSTLSLPVAHTCFFSVELPPYTTLEKMTTMLLATINFGLGGILMA